MEAPEVEAPVCWPAPGSMRTMKFSVISQAVSWAMRTVMAPTLWLAVKVSERVTPNSPARKSAASARPELTSGNPSMR